MEDRRDLLEAMHRDLHDLCQPLTALQCRLEMGRLLGGKEDLQQAVYGSLAETRRIFAAVAKMRAYLQDWEQVQRMGSIDPAEELIGAMHTGLKP
jgi:hypothetical protein